jgi:hypothetical protein
VRSGRGINNNNNNNNNNNLCYIKNKGEGRPFVSLSRRWEDNIRKDLREVGREDVDWIHMAQVP